VLLVSPLDVPTLEAEWLASHPGYNIVRGGAQAAMGQAFATAIGLHRAALLAIRTPDGRLAGVLSYLAPSQYPNEHDSFHISWLGVEEDLQGQGFGRELVRSLASIAARSGKPITTAPASPQSKQFFVNLGFAYSGWGYGFGRSRERHYTLPALKVMALHAQVSAISSPVIEVAPEPYVPFSHPFYKEAAHEPDL
jgi:GNAT superfamily N-acetyltransferase